MSDTVHEHVSGGSPSCRATRRSTSAVAALRFLPMRNVVEWNFACWPHEADRQFMERFSTAFSHRKKAISVSPYRTPDAASV